MSSGLTNVEATPDGRDNLLYRHLPVEQQLRWDELLKPVHLRPGDTLFAPGEKLQHVYFPISTVISLVAMSHDGACALVATVGYEGLAGLPALFGGEATLQAVVQNGGIALRLEAAELVSAFHQHEDVRRHLLRYVQVFFMQLGQGALCNRHHSAEQQLCSLILRTLDRRQQAGLQATHENLAGILGWRRETVSHAAHRLQLAGLLHNTRGQITVVDRKALERFACECYGAVQKSYARLWYAPGLRSAAAV